VARYDTPTSNPSSYVFFAACAPGAWSQVLSYSTYVLGFAANGSIAAVNSAGEACVAFSTHRLCRAPHHAKLLNEGLPGGSKLQTLSCAFIIVVTQFEYLILSTEP
jgi:hypothetical protein